MVTALSDGVNGPAVRFLGSVERILRDQFWTEPDADRPVTPVRSLYPEIDPVCRPVPDSGDAAFRPADQQEMKPW
jgi:hypothetical protein